MNKRLLIVFILGFSSGLPLALLTSTLQAWFADSGMSVIATAALSLVGLPYLYRMLWAPLLDRYSLLPLGKRRSWIFMMQVLLCTGFYWMSWLSPQIAPKWMAGLAFVLASISATQDAAIDAHRTEYLPIEEHALGASLATLGYRIALLVAGGAALIIASTFGWATTYRIMGLLFILGIVATLWSPEPHRPQSSLSRASFATSFIAPLNALFKRKKLLLLCIFIIFYKLGEAFTTTTSGIMMPFLIQGIGFSLETIAYVNKIIGVVAIVLGGLLAGILLLRWSLYRALFVFGLLQALTNALFVWLAIAGKQVLILSMAVICDNFAAGMGSTALVALFMRLVDKRYTATQLSIFVAISAVPRVVSGPVAAWIQIQVGWVGLYQWSFVFALLFIPFLIKIRELIVTSFDSDHQLLDPIGIVEKTHEQ